MSHELRTPLNAIIGFSQRCDQAVRPLAHALCELRRRHRRQRRASADADQRHPRHVADRGRQLEADEESATSAQCRGLPPPGAPNAPRRRRAPARSERRRCRPARRRARAQADPAQPAVQRRQVHARAAAASPSRPRRHATAACRLRSPTPASASADGRDQGCSGRSPMPIEPPSAARYGGAGLGLPSASTWWSCMAARSRSTPRPEISTALTVTLPAERAVERTAAG